MTSPAEGPTRSAAPRREGGSWPGRSLARRQWRRGSLVAASTPNRRSGTSPTIIQTTATTIAPTPPRRATRPRPATTRDTRRWLPTAAAPTPTPPLPATAGMITALIGRPTAVALPLRAAAAPMTRAGKTALTAPPAPASMLARTDGAPGPPTPAMSDARAALPALFSRAKGPPMSGPRRLPPSVPCFEAARVARSPAADRADSRARRSPPSPPAPERPAPVSAPTRPAPPRPPAPRLRARPPALPFKSPHLCPALAPGALGLLRSGRCMPRVRRKRNPHRIAPCA
jgi:hypothetical protein